MTTPVVADGGADPLRHLVQISNQLADGFLLQFRLRLKSCVHIAHISRVVLPVMDFHRPGIDVWFQRVERVRKLWEFIGHSGLLSAYSCNGDPLGQDL